MVTTPTPAVCFRSIAAERFNLLAKPDSNIDRLLNVMAALRHPDTGCPWDIEQNFASIAPYTIEEAYEVVDAIERDDMQDLRDELGDLLLQVVFHARMAQEAGLFDFEEVAGSISDKLLRRHPHVFADSKVGSAEEQQAAWEAHKATERKASGKSHTSVIDGITRNLPALTLAVKTGKRAASVGFDWDNAEQVVTKIHEELDEIAEARARNDQADIEEEVGDLLLAVTNLARHLNIDPEQALRKANQKFVSRFIALEASIRDAGADWKDFSLEELEARWQAVKKLPASPV